MKLHAGTYFGVPLFFHCSWFFLPFFASFFGVEFLSVVFATTFFVILHEYGHCLMAKFFDLPVKDVTLFPFGGLAAIYFKPGRPKEELFIALAGPIVNLIFAIIFISLFLFTSAYFLCLLVVVNILLAVFNLLPVLPMDGGRVLRACLGFGFNHLLATRLAVRISQTISLVLIFLGIYFGHIIISLTFCFMFVAAQIELVNAKRQDYLQFLTTRIGEILEMPELTNATLTELKRVIDTVENGPKKEKLIFFLENTCTDYQN